MWGFNMKVLINNTFNPIFGMSNMLGKNIKLDGPLSVSFYFGSKHTGVPKGGEIPHGVRVKIFPNPEKFRENGSFTMELHGDYATSENDLSAKELKIVRNFFKKYKVLFAGAWEECIEEDDITAYLRSRISLQELVQDMPQYDQFKQYLDDVETIEDLESTVRNYNLFNMWD